MSVNYSPDSFWLDWHIEMFDSKWRESINNGAHDRGSSTDCSCLANTFHAKRVDRRRSFSSIQYKVRNVRRSGYCIIHQCASDQLALFVVDHFFKHGLAN